MKSCLQPIQIFVKYLDLLQDILLTYFIIKAMGGIGVVLQNPAIFSSVVSFVTVENKVQDRPGSGQKFHRSSRAGSR